MKFIDRKELLKVFFAQSLPNEAVCVPDEVGKSFED